MAAPEDIRLVVAIDFGTTFSGLAAAHVSDPNTVEVFNQWNANNGTEKVPTIIYYQNKEPKAWGYAQVLGNDVECVVAELFKLRQCEDLKQKPPLPDWLEADTATVDYLKNLGKVLKDWIKERWGVGNNAESVLKYPDHIRFIVTVPVEWSPEARENTKRLLAAAEIIPDASFRNIDLLSEAEAAAIYCLRKSGQYNLRAGDAYLVVDCGGGTCDAATLKIVEGRKIVEVAESDYSMPAGNSVDEKFMELLARRLNIGIKAMRTIRQDNHKLLSNFIRNFFWPVKHSFNGTCDEVRMDLDDECPKLVRLANKARGSGTGETWIKIGATDLEGFFKEAVDGIIQLIRKQLENMRRLAEAQGDAADPIKKIFLVGGFGSSPWLRKRVEQEFGEKVAIPQQPIAGVLRGAVYYGLDFDTDSSSETYGFNTTVESRILRYTYGTSAFSFMSMLMHEKPIVFVTIAKRGEKARTGLSFKEDFTVSPGQKKADSTIYYTREDEANTPEDPHVKVLKKWMVKLDDSEADMKKSRKFEMGLAFLPTPRAYAKNSETGRKYEVIEFELPPDEFADE